MPGFGRSGHSVDLCRTAASARTARSPPNLQVISHASTLWFPEGQLQVAGQLLTALRFTAETLDLFVSGQYETGVARLHPPCTPCRYDGRGHRQVSACAHGSPVQSVQHEASGGAGADAAGCFS